MTVYRTNTPPKIDPIPEPCAQCGDATDHWLCRLDLCAPAPLTLRGHFALAAQTLMADLVATFLRLDRQWVRFSQSLPWSIFLLEMPITLAGWW